MTDARLLATNPENSSLVPVACNAQGQLLVTDVQIEEIPNDVTLSGDLTVTGSATFAGVLTGENEAYFDGRVGCGVDANSEVMAYGVTARNNFDETSNSSAVFGQNFNADGRVWCGANSTGSTTSEIYGNGSASFAGDVQVGGNPHTETGVDIRAIGLVKAARTGTTDALWAGYTTGESSATSQIFADGSATFASGNAGITEEGYFWCTTRRGDTVILDATSNGLATWASYTPSTRRDLIKEKVAEWSEKDKVDDDFGVSLEDAGES